MRTQVLTNEKNNNYGSVVNCYRKCKNKMNFTGFSQLMLDDHVIYHCFGSLFVAILHSPDSTSPYQRMHESLILVDEVERATNDSFAIELLFSLQFPSNLDDKMD